MTDWTRWECFVDVKIGPKGEDVPMLKAEDAATMQYPPDWSARKCAAEFLIAVAKEIEQGDIELQEEAE